MSYALQKLIEARLGDRRLARFLALVRYIIFFLDDLRRSGEGQVVHGHWPQHQGGRLQPRVSVQLPQDQPLGRQDYLGLKD